MLDFELPAELEAHEPPEERGERDRGDVRLMVSEGDLPPVHTRFADLWTFLDPGDVLLVNTSATMPAAIDGDLPTVGRVVVHFSSRLGRGRWVVELRRPHPPATEPLADDVESETVAIEGGGLVQLVERMAGSRRLWTALVWTPVEVEAHLAVHGRPIRYGYVPSDWPLDAYQSVFALRPGSAEMPSASRPFTADAVIDLVVRGVVIAPLTLHTGVSSLEAHERPYPERFEVPATTARLVRQARAAGRRVIAVGTTAVRAIESATDHHGVVRASSGWTELVITPERGVRAVDGLLTGWHEPAASHLLMLEGVAGRHALELAYPAAIEAGYRWHEFGDVHLLVTRPGTGADLDGS